MITGVVFALAFVEVSVEVGSPYLYLEITSLSRGDVFEVELQVSRERGFDAWYIIPLAEDGVFNVHERGLARIFELVSLDASLV